MSMIDAVLRGSQLLLGTGRVACVLGAGLLVRP